MRVTVTPSRVEATVGTPQQVAVTIVNPEAVIGGYSLRVLGADPSWVTLEESRISLFPDESRTVVVTITVPPGLAAGERRMAVQVRELTPPERSTVEELVLVVPKSPSTQVRVDPMTQTAGRTGRFSLLVDNNGNTPARGWFAGDDAEGKLRYRFDPPVIDLAPGEHAVVNLRVRGRRPFAGQPALRALHLHLVDGWLPLEAAGKPDAPPPPDPEQAPAATAALVQTALLSRGPIGLVGLLAAITVFAVVITIALSRLVGQSAADRNLALEIASNDGSSSVSGSSGLGGTVRQLTTGRPLDNVAVDVYLADDLITPVASIATRDNGRYRFDGLAAGDYKLSFRGAGFERLWYPRSVDAENAEPVTVQENNRVVGLDIALGGLPAAISGKVIGEDVTDATVALRTPSTTVPVGDGSTIGSAEDGDGATVQTAPVASDGTFAFADVPSPSVYDLVVTKEGFATSTQRVDVAPGEERDGVEINLVRGNGIVSGRVLDNGAPLDSATITVTSGDASASTMSLSSGEFTLRRLPTPATYTLTASKEGYASESLSVTLADGQALTGLTLSLSDSAGTIAGVARLRDGGPAGGVTVTVTDGVQTVQTATQSTGAIGGWEVSGLAVPATYTVTLSRADLAPATVSVSLDESGRIVDPVTAAGTIETVLTSATAVLHGTVLQRGIGPDPRPVGEVTVQLTSGASTYTVVSASVPRSRLGRYRIEGLPPGTYTVSVARSGVRPTSTIIELTAGAADFPYDPVLAPPASISGEIRGAREGATYLVELYRASDYPGVVYRTTRSREEDGHYEFVDIDAPEVYVVQVRRTTGSVPLDSVNVTVDASEAHDGTDLRVDR